MLGKKSSMKSMGQIKVRFHLVQVFIPAAQVNVGSRRQNRLRRTKQRTSVFAHAPLLGSWGDVIPAYRADLRG
jgi:hypothetical protein